MSTPIDLTFLRERPVQKRIAAMAVVFALAGTAYAILAPKWYRASITVVPAKSQKGGSGIASMLGGDLGGLAAGLGASLGEGADVQRIAAVLQSTVVTDAAIEKFDLKKRYDERYQENAREKLWKHCDVKVLPKPSLVQLSCEDKDPRFVQDLLAFFAEHGNQVFRRIGVSSASEQVRFLEKRVADLRAQADDTASRMRAFQEKYQIVDIETQTKAVVGAIASLNGMRINKQLELDFARTFSSGDESTLKQLESQIAVMDRKLHSLEEDRGTADGVPPASSSKRAGNGVFPAALSVPKLRAEYETLYRDRRVSEATLIFALERLEAAKADEARDTSTFLVLDPPVLPTRHVRPKRSMAVFAALMLGLACGVAVEWWRRSGFSLVPAASTAKPQRAA